MDPTETFNAMLEAYGLGSYDEAVEHAEQLTNWLNRDGFAPRFNLAAGGKSITVTDRLSRDICRAACRLVLDQPEASGDLET
ncbi:MAG: hypothetical protein R3C56_37035 [Pirellulaceae bacterium]